MPPVLTWAQTSVVKSDVESCTWIESCLKSNSGKKGEWLPGFLVNTIIDPKQETDNMEVLALPASLGGLCAVWFRGALSNLIWDGAFQINGTDAAPQHASSRQFI